MCLQFVADGETERRKRKDCLIPTEYLGGGLPSQTLGIAPDGALEERKLCDPKVCIIRTKLAPGPIGRDDGFHKASLLRNLYAEPSAVTIWDCLGGA